MFWRKVLHGVALLTIVMTIPVVLLLGNLYLLATPIFLKIEYGKADFPPAPGFTDAERLYNAEATLAYLRSPQPIQTLAKLEQNGQPLYNYRELIHLADVKRVMHGALVVFWVALAALLVAIFYVLWRSDLRARLPVYVFWGCVALVITLATIGVFAWANFDAFFFTFHRFFFAGESWLFSASDSLIRLFPLRFWMDATALWLLLSVGEAVIVGSAAYLWPGWKHKR